MVGSANGYKELMLWIGYFISFLSRKAKLIKLNFLPPPFGTARGFSF